MGERFSMLVDTRDIFSTTLVSLTSPVMPAVEVCVRGEMVS